MPEHRPILNWNDASDRDLGKMFFNQLAGSREEAAASASGSRISADGEWHEREVGAIALALWLKAVSPKIPDTADADLVIKKGLVAATTLQAIQELLPHRTIKDIVHALAYRHAEVDWAWERIMGVDTQSPAVYGLNDILSVKHIEILCDASEKEAEEWYNAEFGDDTDGEDDE